LDIIGVLWWKRALGGFLGRNGYNERTRHRFVEHLQCDHGITNGEDSTLRAAHPLFIVKTVNSILPPGKRIESAALVRSGIALTPKAGTTPEDLQNKDRISTSLGNGVERMKNG
jgi:hypothetical protein